MKIRDSLGVPDNLRAIDREDQMEKEVLKRDRDSVNERKDEVVRFCSGPTGASSKELASIIGYSHPSAIVPMLRLLMKEHRIYRDKYRYYKVRVEPAVVAAVVDPVKAISPKEVIGDHKNNGNEDKFIKFVEDMAKDFIWQAEGVKVHQVKRFVDYIKANKGGR